MPITASLGSLSYVRTSLATNNIYEDWYLEASNLTNFRDMTSDANNSIYIASNNNANIDLSTSSNITNIDVALHRTSSPSLEITNSSNNISTLGVYFDTTNSQLCLAGQQYGYSRIITGITYYGRWGTVITTDSSFGSITKFRDDPDNSVATGNAAPYYKSFYNVYKDGSDTFVSGVANENISRGTPDYANFVNKYNGSNILSGQTSVREPTRLSSITANFNAIVIPDSPGNVIYNTKIYQDSLDPIVIVKFPNVAGVPPGFNAWLWQVKLTKTATTNLQVGGIALDSSKNIYTVIWNSATDISYIVKYNPSGVLQWQREIASTQLKDIHIDASNNIYLTGVTSLVTANAKHIVCYNSSGVLQWQNQFSYGNGGLKILGFNGYIYIMSINNILRVKDTGAIPGTGTYNILPSGTIATYTVATNTESAGTLTSATSTYNQAVLSTTSTSNNGPTTNAVAPDGFSFTPLF
jgi:hypothetical protein